MKNQDSRNSTISFGIYATAGVCAFGAVLIAYGLGYFWLGETFGSQSIEEASKGSSLAITFSGPHFLDRLYPNQLCATVFAPGAMLESSLTGVEVRAVDRSKIDFDWTIDDNSTLAIEANDESLPRDIVLPSGEIIKGEDLILVETRRGTLTPDRAESKELTDFVNNVLRSRGQVSNHPDSITANSP